MNENIGRNVADITSEVKMVEKSQNQEIYVSLLFVQNIKMTIMKAEKRKDIQEEFRDRSRPRMQEDQCRQRCDAG